MKFGGLTGFFFFFFFFFFFSFLLKHYFLAYFHFYSFMVNLSIRSPKYKNYSNNLKKGYVMSKDQSRKKYGKELPYRHNGGVDQGSKFLDCEVDQYLP